MINKVKHTMKIHNMFPTRSVLVALSGGADSVALLHIMHTLSREYGFTVYAAHVNHNLRGEAAKNDEKFSKSLCHRLGIECFVESADVLAMAKEQGISEEMAGRRVRYDFFERLMQKFDIEYTATAHHKNDNAETILMNFVRGSGLSGLSGIPYKRDRYIRPLLDVKRCDIESYCVANDLNYVTDATNLNTVYTRNKIRNIIIPQLENELNPNFADTITSNARIIGEDEDFINSVADTEYAYLVADNSIDVLGLTSLHSAVAKRIIRKLIDNICGIADVSSLAIETVYDICKKGNTGLNCNIIRDITARIEYGRLVIDKLQTPCEDFSYSIKIGESKFIPELGYTVTVSWDGDGERFSVPESVDEICITNRRAGDRFVPKGMQGSKSIKAFMIDEKIPQNRRNRTGIVRIGGEIAWIIGYRRDARFIGNDIVISISQA